MQPRFSHISFGVLHSNHLVQASKLHTFWSLETFSSSLLFSGARSLEDRALAMLRFTLLGGSSVSLAMRSPCFVDEFKRQTTCTRLRHQVFGVRLQLVIFRPVHYSPLDPIILPLERDYCVDSRVI